MLARYQIVRGKRSPDDPLPEGKRIDTRKHTKHFLRPEEKWVTELLQDPSDAAFQRFARLYNAALEQRFREHRALFDELAETAKAEDVYLGCSCPTAKNPDVRRCHTVLALTFMHAHYPKLRVKLPPAS
jgi:hypothetical protein